MQQAGLPNIIGEVKTTAATSSENAMGAFATTDGVTYTIASGSNYIYQSYRLVMSASLYNSIYGSSDTVQPPSLTTIFLIKY